jgi:chromosome segregation ATPase
MSESPPKRRRTLLESIGNDIDHLEEENEDLKKEIERLRTDNTEIKRLDRIRSKEMFDLNTSKRQLERVIKDKDVDLDEERDVVQELRDKVEELRTQIDEGGQATRSQARDRGATDELQRQIEALTNQNEALITQNKALTAVVKDAYRLSQQATPIKTKPSNESKYSSEDEPSVEVLWANRLGSLSVTTLVQLLTTIYTQDFKDRMEISDIRDMIGRIHKESEQKVSSFTNLATFSF